MPTTVTVEAYTIPAALLGPDNPLPFFRDQRHDSPTQNDGTLTDEESRYLGWETAFRVLPYTMQDNYHRDLQPHAFTGIVLESERYRAVLLPELGARLVSFIHKTDSNRELLFCNPNFQPANLSIRNAWFSGGIEWNIGQLGHTFSTCSPVFAARIHDDQGNEGVRFYDFERCKRLFWQLDLFLLDIPAGLTAHVKVVNPNTTTIPMYWWTNIAVPEAQGCRVLAPADRGIFKLPEKDGFGGYSLPNLPSIDNRDGTYSLNHPISNEFFFQCDSAQMPWEVLADLDGHMFLEYSTPQLTARKLFCWGIGQGGRHWQEYLNDHGNDYIEIQAGLTPVQSCSIPMPPATTWHWTQVFSTLQGDPAAIHSSDWAAARGEVQRRLADVAGYRDLEAANTRLSAAADRAPGELLFSGTGWGRLEQERMVAAGEPLTTLVSVPFPPESLGPDQAPWLQLLQHDSFTATPELEHSWMVQPHWQARLEALPEARLDWTGFLHLGVMYREQGEIDRAVTCWKRSLTLHPSALTQRCLAIIAREQNDLPTAIAGLQAALQQAAVEGNHRLRLALAVEFLRMLRDNSQWELTAATYEAFESEIRQHETLKICYATALVKLDRLEGVEDLLLQNYALIREGEISLSNIWQELWARRIARGRDEILSEAHFTEALDRYPPPYLIDFRMI